MKTKYTLLLRQLLLMLLLLLLLLLSLLQLLPLLLMQILLRPLLLLPLQLLLMLLLLLLPQPRKQSLETKCDGLDLLLEFVEEPGGRADAAVDPLLSTGLCGRFDVLLMHAATETPGGRADDAVDPESLVSDVCSFAVDCVFRGDKVRLAQARSTPAKDDGRVGEARVDAWSLGAGIDRLRWTGGRLERAGGESGPIQLLDGDGRVVPVTRMDI